MSQQRVARRYARAFYELAEEKDLVDRLNEDLQQFHRFWLEAPELRRLLRGRRIDPGEKKALLTDAFSKIYGGEPHRYFRNFLLLIIDKHRITHLSAVVDIYTGFVDAANGVERGSVVFAGNPDESLRNRLEEELSAVRDKTVILETKVDAEILGGMVVRIGDLRFDGSLRYRLQQMQRTLEG